MIKILNMSYEEACKEMQKKYGLPEFPYMDENWERDTRNARKGYQIHHIAENVYFNLCDSFAASAQDPEQKYQQPEWLCYCNKLEHLVLHYLETKENGRRFFSPGELELFKQCETAINLDKEYAKEPWISQKEVILKDYTKEDYLEVKKNIFKDLKGLSQTAFDLETKTWFESSYNETDINFLITDEQVQEVKKLKKSRKVDKFEYEVCWLDNDNFLHIETSDSRILSIATVKELSQKENIIAIWLWNNKLIGRWYKDVENEWHFRRTFIINKEKGGAK